MFGGGAAPVLNDVGYHGCGRGRYDGRSRLRQWRDSGPAQSGREGRQAGALRMPVRFTGRTQLVARHRFTFGAWHVGCLERAGHRWLGDCRAAFHFVSVAVADASSGVSDNDC